MQQNQIDEDDEKLLVVMKNLNCMRTSGDQKYQEIEDKLATLADFEPPSHRKRIQTIVVVGIVWWRQALSFFPLEYTAVN